MIELLKELLLRLGRFTLASRTHGVSYEQIYLPADSAALRAAADGSFEHL